jgi:uncharacterized protein YbaA (DUF1428 family)
MPWGGVPYPKVTKRKPFDKQRLSFGGFKVLVSR